MALDDFADDRDYMSDEDIQEATEEFKSKEPKSHSFDVVYGIYHKETGECLYVGEAKRLISRMNDHYNTKASNADSDNTFSEIKACVHHDSEIDLTAENVWEKTEIKHIEDVSQRKEVEQALIQEIQPRYNSE